MNLSTQLAKHFRDIHFGGNWTCSNLKDNLEGISWQQAITKIDSLNTIAALVFHANYFVEALLNVLQGNALAAHDKYSYDVPPILSQGDWDNLLDKTFRQAQETAHLIEALPESKLWENFSEEKYGSYYRNIQGIIEHTHYHLGQIAIIKKLITAGRK